MAAHAVRPLLLADAQVLAETRKKVIWDRIHGHMGFHPVIVTFIDTKQFQRLRYIKQLGGVSYVFPNAVHTRFEHCLGCCHLAGELIRNLQQKQPELGITDAEVLCVQVAALCHDLGQGPFSHVFQDLVAPDLEHTWSRIEFSIKMFEKLLKDNPHVSRCCEEYSFSIDHIHRELIKDMIRGKTSEIEEEKPSEQAPASGDTTCTTAKDESAVATRPAVKKPFLLEIVRNYWSGIDVCKMDYVTRDCHSTAMGMNMEWRRYIEYARVIGGHICTRTKVAGNIADLLDQRKKLYSLAYYHKTVRMIEYQISRALIAAKDEPVIRREDGSMASINDAINGDMDAFTRLTDSVLHQIMMCSDQANQIIQHLELRGNDPRPTMRFIECATCSEPEKQVDFDQEDIKKQFTEKMNAKASKIADSPLGNSKPFWVDQLVCDYNLENKDIFECEMFYTREEPKKAVVIPKDQVPRSLPKSFRGVEIRVYTTSQEHYDMYCKNKEKFNKTFEKVCRATKYKKTRLR